MGSSIILSFLQFLLTYLLLTSVGIFAMSPSTLLTESSMPTSPLTSLKPDPVSNVATTGWIPDYAVLETPFSSLQTVSAFVQFGDGSVEGWSELSGWNGVREDETTSVDPLEGFIAVYEEDLEGPVSPVVTGWMDEGGMWETQVEMMA